MKALLEKSDTLVKPKEDTDTKKMVISILGGNSVNMTAEEIQAAMNMLEKGNAKGLASPFTMVDNAVIIFKKMSIDSISAFLDSVMADREQFPQGCILDEKLFDTYSMRLSEFTDI